LLCVFKETGCWETEKKLMFMTSEEAFGSQWSLRGVPPSEKLHSLPKIHTEIKT